MSFKYILFDLDGTLTDPKEGITKSVQHALRAFGIDEPDLDQLVSFIGPPLIESFRDFYDFTPEQALEGVAKYREYFCDRGIFENKVIPGIPRLLQNLKENGKILCLATSKPEPFARKILEHFDLMQWFDETVGASLDESRGTKLLRMHSVACRSEKKSGGKPLWSEIESTIFWQHPHLSFLLLV